jgi:hypothetical protein
MGQSTIFTAQRAQPPSNHDPDEIWRDQKAYFHYPFAHFDGLTARSSS